MSPCLHKKGLCEIHNDLLVPKCTTKSAGVCIRMKCAMYMDACILEFRGEKKKKSVNT
jgi:hypothetical protein